MFGLVVVINLTNTIGRAIVRLAAKENKPTIALVILSVLLIVMIICTISRRFIIMRYNKINNLETPQDGFKMAVNREIEDSIYIITSQDALQDESQDMEDSAYPAFNEIADNKCLLCLKKRYGDIIIAFQLLAICFYFFGDNFYYVMNRYGGCLCGTDCINNCNYVAVASLGCAGICYAIVKILQEHEDKQKTEDGVNFLPIIAVIAQMDILYTIATSRLKDKGKLVASVILLIMTGIIGIAIILGKTIKLWKENEERREDDIFNVEKKQCTGIRTMIILLPFCVIVSLAFHTLGDNLEPLDSIITCMEMNSPEMNYSVTVLGNSTEITEANIGISENMNCLEEESCEVNSKVRLTMGIVSLACLAIPLIYTFVTWNPMFMFIIWVIRKYKQKYKPHSCLCWHCNQDEMYSVQMPDMNTEI